MKFISSQSFTILILFLVNTGYSQSALKTGIWEATLRLNDSTNLPFKFEVKNNHEKLSFEMINAEERIVVDEILLKGDSVFIKMPVFDSEFRCLHVGDSLTGNWINHSRKDKKIIPFNASPPKSIFYSKAVLQNEKLNLLIGRWKCIFSPNTKDESFAIGLFKPNTLLTKIAGTFLTEEGDYRFLEGDVYEGAEFRLSCFDGSHAFLFTGNFVNSDSIAGNFYSGSHFHEQWVAQRNEKFELRDPEKITYLKPGFSKVDFKFKNLAGKEVSLNDEKFKNKVVIIQLTGTWCPNCMDETNFLASFYEKYKSKGLEIVGLAFERTDDFNKAVNNIQRTKKRFNANYEFLITGKTGKD
nr:TlpA family protein disulfide reductase [Bacteroidota bacterium]